MKIVILIFTLGTRWAYGPTASQNSLEDYSTLNDAVYSFHMVLQVVVKLFHFIILAICFMMLHLILGLKEMVLAVVPVEVFHT